MIALLLCAAIGADDAPAFDVTTITATQVRKKLKGKTKWTPKKGELTIEYDFASKPSLADWDTGKKKPKVEGRTLLLYNGDSATHCVEWKTVEVSANISLKQLNGDFLKLGCGGVFSAGGANRDAVYLWAASKTDSAVQIVAQNHRVGIVPFRVRADEERFTGEFGSAASLSRPNPKTTAGAVKLLGGEDRYGFSKVTMSGTIDPKWAEKFFK